MFPPPKMLIPITFLMWFCISTMTYSPLSVWHTKSMVPSYLTLGKDLRISEKWSRIFLKNFVAPLSSRKEVFDWSMTPSKTPGKELRRLMVVVVYFRWMNPLNSYSFWTGFMCSSTRVDDSILRWGQTHGKMTFEWCHHWGCAWKVRRMLVFQKNWMKEGCRSFCVSFLELGVPGLCMSAYFLPKNRLIRGRRAKEDLKHTTSLIFERRTKETHSAPTKFVRNHRTVAV